MKFSGTSIEVCFGRGTPSANARVWIRYAVGPPIMVDGRTRLRPPDLCPLSPSRPGGEASETRRYSPRAWKEARVRNVSSTYRASWKMHTGESVVQRRIRDSGVPHSLRVSS